MKLTTISATNFKGGTFRYDLTAITIFVGLNFRGKTRVMDAIRLALLGYLPELGKSNASTWGLSSGMDMEVQAAFDDGTIIRRRWALKGDSVVRDEDLPDMARFGDLTVMMNAETYFALSDRKRVEYVAAHCPASVQDTSETLLARLYEKLKAEHEVDDVLGFVDHSGKLTFGVIAANAQEFLDAQIDGADQIVKVSKAHADIQQKTIQGLSYLRAQDDPAISLNVLESTRAKINAEITRLTNERAAKLGDFTAMKSDAQRREVIDRELRFADKNRQEHVALTGRLSLIDTELANAQSPESADLQTLAQQLKDLEIENATIGSDLRGAERALKEGMFLVDQIDEAQTCPYCGAAGDGWKALRLAELAQEVDKQATTGADLLKQQADLGDRIAAVAVKVKVAQDEGARLRRLNNDRAEVTGKIAFLATALARLDTLTEELARLRTNDPQLTTDVELLQTALNIQQQDLRKVDSDIKEAMGRAHELQRLAEAEKERDEALAELAVAKDAAKELRAIQAEMVDAAFKPLLDIANSFFGSVLKSPLAYHQSEVGTWRDGLFVGHHTFSGTERLLTYAAIQMALASRSPFRLMLMDELGRLDGTSFAALLLCVDSALHAGSIDQFIGAAASGSGERMAAGNRNSAFQIIEIQ